jgi:indolepyruvate ferredoxin oxidoreductase alpha subunit
MNVAYPLVEEELDEFCQASGGAGAGGASRTSSSRILLTSCARRGCAKLHGKDLLPLAGEYNTATVLAGLRAFFERYDRLEPDALAAARQVHSAGQRDAGRRQRRAACAG